MNLNKPQLKNYLAAVLDRFYSVWQKRWVKAVLSMIFFAVMLVSLFFAWRSGYYAFASKQSWTTATTTASFTVPTGVYYITAKLWGGGAGGGGGGDASPATPGGAGGGGGFITATIPVTPGETLTVLVGGPGVGGTGDTDQGGGGGGGGGYSAVKRGSTNLLMAAGGAGGGGGDDTTDGTGGAGSPGGGLIAASGTNAGTAYAGGGGTQTAGGGAGTGSNGNGEAGDTDGVTEGGDGGGGAVAGAGGAGGQNGGGAGGSGNANGSDSGGAGGGGAGYHGGGGGGASEATDGAAGGGGGSSWATSTALLVSTLSGSGTSTATSTDFDYTGGAGVGGNGGAGGAGLGATGTPGLVVLTWGAVSLYSAADQVFSVGAATTSAATIRVSDTGGNITTNDIRITIATTSVNMRWGTVNTVTLSGTAWNDDVTDNSVTYENNGATAVINVANSFEAGDYLDIAGLSFKDFGSINLATPGLQLDVDGSGGTMATATDPRTVQIVGSLAVGEHGLGSQVGNQWSSAYTSTTTVHYRYSLAPSGEKMNIGTTTFNLNNIIGINSTDIYNFALFSDNDKDGIITASSSWELLITSESNGGWASMVETDNYLFRINGYNVERCLLSNKCDEADDWAQTNKELTFISYDHLSKVLYGVSTTPSKLIERCDLSTGCDNTDWSISTTTSNGSFGFFDFAIDDSSRVIYFGQGGNNSNAAKVYRCEISSNCDGPNDWTISFSSIGLDFTDALEFDPVNEAMFLGAYEVGVGVNLYRCDTNSQCDNNADWALVKSSATGWINDFVYDPMHKILYYSDWSGPIYRCDVNSLCDTTDDWIMVFDSPYSFGPKSLAFNQNNGILYMGDGSGHVYTCSSKSGCDTDTEWVVSTTTINNEIDYIAVDQVNNTVYALSGVDTGLGADYGIIRKNEGDQNVGWFNGSVNMASQTGSITFATSVTYVLGMLGSDFLLELTASSTAVCDQTTIDFGTASTTGAISGWSIVPTGDPSSVKHYIGATVTVANHGLGSQAGNQWASIGDNITSVHYRYRLAPPAGTTINLGTTTIDLSAISGVSAGDITDARLYIDTDNNGVIATNTKNWTVLRSGVAGTLLSTSGIDQISSMASVYGTLYVGTWEFIDGVNDNAEVYRYNGGTSWTKITQSTVGQIAVGGTSSIDAVYSMANVNGTLYAGTWDLLGIAEVYRYDGGTTWTKVSAGTGQIASGGTSDIDGIYSMANVSGTLYAGTSESNKTEVYRYDGGTGWTLVSQSGGTGQIAAGGTSAISEIYSMANVNGTLYVGTTESGKAEVYRYNGGTSWTKITQSTLGQIAAGGTSGIDGVWSLANVNGTLYAGTYESGKAEVYRYDGGTGWTLVSQSGGTGQIAAGGTSGIDGIDSLVNVNGTLYAGTSESNLVEVYRYNGDTSWTKISSTTAGVIAEDPGPTGSIDAIDSLANVNGTLYAGTSEAGKAEVYRYDADSQVWGPGISSLPGTTGSITFSTTTTYDIGSSTDFLLELTVSNLGSGGASTPVIIMQGTLGIQGAVSFQIPASTGGGDPDTITMDFDTVESNTCDITVTGDPGSVQHEKQ